MNLKNYLNSLTPKIFKILPMFEERDPGLPAYLERLLAELRGSTYTFPDLAMDGFYVSVINNLNYLLHYEFNKSECKRMVFDSISLVERIAQERGSVDG